MPRVVCQHAQANRAAIHLAQPEVLRRKMGGAGTRHHKYHDTEYNLEPNVKKVRGVARHSDDRLGSPNAISELRTLRELVVHEFLTESELVSLTAGQNYLWQVRFALHSITGRCEDRLLFDYQKELADRFGLKDDQHHLAVGKADEAILSGDQGTKPP